MRRRCFLILNFIVLLAFITGCKGGAAPVPADKAPRINPPVQIPAAIKDFPKISERNASVPDNYETVAENATLRLYLNKKSSAIIVEDRRNGRLWRSSPDGLADNKGTTTAWRSQIEYPVQVAYTDADRSQSKNAKVDKAVKLSFKPVKDGVRVTYSIPNLKLSFDVIYALKDDSLEAIVPEKNVLEKGPNGFVSIDMLAYFGATRDGEEGYIVYPDGSGALMSFKTPHPPEVQKISTVVYGTDASAGFSSLNTSVFRELITMPVFGLVSSPSPDSKDLSGFVAIITNGDFDANLGIARAGKGINYNHVWSTLLFRRQGRFSLTGGQPTLLYQPDRITGDRVVRFCFLNGAEANYVGMASRYRDFLIKERGATRIDSRPVGAGEAEVDKPGLPFMNLAFFMGTERKTWFLSDMVSMTTFDQAKAILKDLEKAGVTQIDVSLWNWNKAGTAEKYPQRFPVDSRLGGENALRGLAEDMHRRGQRLFLNDNYLTTAPGAPGVFPYMDAIRGVDGLPIGSDETGYLLNPQVALRNYGSRDIPKMAPLGADGLELTAMGFLAIPDKNQRYPLSREAFAATYMQFFKFTRQQLGAVSTDGSNAYAAQYADRLDYVAMDSTHFDFFDETVPLYQIAIHGLTQYTNEPYNLLSDGRRIFLRQVEYGAIPHFLLTEENSANLFRTKNNGIYSSQYTYWRDEVIRQYQAAEELAPMAAKFITNHEKLTDDVFRVTYDDNSQVIVNYAAEPYKDGTTTVPGQDFIVIRGE